MMIGQEPGTNSSLRPERSPPDLRAREQCPGPAEYKRAVVAEYTRRAFGQALATARGEG